jgi:hypothetical protein
MFVETRKRFVLTTRARGVARQTTVRFQRIKDMNTRTKLILTCAGLLLTISAFAPSARANLLVDPGFEANPLTTDYNVLNFFATYQGVWGVEVATITGVDGGVTPAQGVKMLRMTDDGLTWTQGFQVTDVTSYAAFIDSGGATVNMSALLNADKNVPAALGEVSVQFFGASNYGSQIGTGIAGSLTLDNFPNTWQTASVSGAIPVGTRWLLSQVLYQDASLVSNPGYVDATNLTITPEPGTLVLLGCGLVGLFCYAWRRR